MQHDKGTTGTVSLRISRPRPPVAASTFPVKQGNSRRDSHKARRPQNHNHNQNDQPTIHHLRHSRGKLFAVLDVAIARASVAATSAASKSKSRSASQASTSVHIDPAHGKALYPAIATGLRWIRAEAELQEEGAEEEGASMSRFSCVGLILPVIDDAISTTEEESWERERFGKLVRFGIKCGNKQKAKRKIRTSSGSKQPFGKREKTRKTSGKDSAAAITPTTATRDHLLMVPPTRDTTMSSSQAGVDGTYTNNTTTPAMLSDTSMMDLDLLPPIPPPLPPSLANTAAAATASSSSIVSLPPPSSTFLRNERRKDRSHKALTKMRQSSAFPSTEELRKRREADPEFSDVAVAQKKEALKRLYPTDADAPGEVSFVRSEDGAARRDSVGKRAKVAHQRNNEGIDSPLELSEDDENDDHAMDHLLTKKKRKGQRRTTSLILEEILATPPSQVSKNRKSSVRVNRRAHTTSSSTSFAQNTRRSMRSVTRPSSDTDCVESFSKSRSRVQSQIEGSQENNEYCRYCGGSGQVLCCDGCPNSFHFDCLSPPIDPEDPPSGRWFCPECCRTQRTTSSGLPLPDDNEKTAMSTLISGSAELNERGFSLPGDVRNYFVGVKTGSKGEYVPTVGSIGDNTGSRTVTWDSVTTNDDRVLLPDRNTITRPESFATRITDSRGKFIFCVRCSRGPSGPRSILSCDYCPCSWHEDCLPYPYNHNSTAKRKPLQKWMCPNHIEHDLGSIQQQGPSAYLKGTGVGRFRRPKHPRYIDVEVLPRSDDDENNGSGAGIHGENANGTVYRVREDGLILDFVERVKKEGMMRIAMREFYNAIVERLNLGNRSMRIEQQATEDLDDGDENDRMDAANSLLGIAASSSSNSHHETDNLEKELVEGIRVINEKLGGKVEEVDKVKDEPAMLQLLKRLVDERIQRLET